MGLKIKKLSQKHVEARQKYCAWLNIISAWKVSEQSGRKFCLSKGVNYQGFLRWRKKIKMLNVVSAYTESKECPSNEIDFIPVSLRDIKERVRDYGSGLMLILENGHQVWIPVDFEAEQLIRVLNLLESKRC